MLFRSVPAEEAPHPLGYAPRPVVIVESLTDKRIELAVTMPDATFGRQTEESVWTPIVERMMQLMADAQTVLVFVNSRRLEVERQLKTGELRVIVATSSLELGIDVGHVDLVLQLDSPLDAASGIQRIGRAGHAVGGVSRGVIVARARDRKSVV